MRLRRIAIGQLPGIDEPFAIEEIGDGIQVIVGPNGIGKSSVCRALRALLWSNRGSEGFISASARFDPQDDADGEPWWVEREGTRHRWLRSGSPCPGPALPAAHLDVCYFLLLRDLLDASDRAGADLAQQVRTQMAGGFDLDEAAGELFAATGKRALHNVRKEVDEAEQAVRQASARHGELARKEQRLGELESRLGEAEAATQQLALLDQALEVSALKERLSHVVSELATLPVATEYLNGNELEEVAQREKERDTKRRQLREVRSQIDTLIEEARDTRLDEPLDPAALAAWRTRADQLATLESQRDSERLTWREYQVELAEAGRVLGSPTDDPPAIDVAGAADLFIFLRQATRADETDDAIRERLAILSTISGEDEGSRQLTLLEQGMASLRAWLRAPDPEDPAATHLRARRIVLLEIAGVLITVAGGLALARYFSWLHSNGVALLGVGAAGLGLGLAIGVWSLRSVGPSDSPRARAERDFPSGLDSPTSWRHTAVAERLHTLEDQAAKQAASAHRLRDRDLDIARLETRRTALEQKRHTLAQERDALAGGLALETIPPDAELVDTARALDTLRLARQAERGAAQRVQELRERHGSLLADLATELGRRDEAQPTDAASARAALDQVIARDGRLRTARQRERDARRTQREHEAELEEITATIAAIYRRAGLAADDRAGLVRLLEDVEPGRKLRREHDACTLAIERIKKKLTQEKLTQADTEALSMLSATQLNTEKARQAALADHRAALTTEIADIRAEVRQAREGDGLEEAIAERDTCQERLAQHRQREIYAAAGRFWLKTVKKEHETTQMPRVLQRARALFAQFTHHAYALRVTPDSAGSFVATEARTGAARRLSQLSDGTRGQLLLAARLAFAEQAEQGTRLPLFLDEALDHSDPERFAAIVASLGHMTEADGRQIFYLTNDPLDVQRIQRALADGGWAPPGVIDLAAIRGRAASVASAEDLFVEGLPEVPSPAGKTVEQYVALLDVPPLDPQRGSAAQHLFHLIWDALPLLHRLLDNGIRTVGQWRMLAARGGRLATAIQASPAIAGVAAQLDDRALLLETFCHAWRTGRGKAVDRKAIEQSQAISDRYLDPVADLTAELDGDGDRILQALRARGDSRLRGFRTKAADDLEAFLTDASYLDPRPVLEEADIATRMDSTPAAAKLPERTVIECCHRWWRLANRAGSGRRGGQLKEALQPVPTGDTGTHEPGPHDTGTQ